MNHPGNDLANGGWHFRAKYPARISWHHSFCVAASLVTMLLKGQAGF